MPTYEYTCKNCGQTIEAFQSFADKPLRKHKECGGGDLQKVFHARGVVFKGSGFYVTDSRAGKSKGAASSGTAGKKDKPSPAGATSSSASADSSSGAAPAKD